MRFGIKTKSPLKRTGVLKDCVPAGSFSGALGSAFYESISRRWGLAGTTLFNPARKIFRKPGRPTDFSPGPTRNAIGVFNFTILSRVQLNFALAVTKRMFSAGANYFGNQKAVTASGDRQVARLPAEASTYEFWSSSNQTISQTSTRIRERSGRQSSWLSFNVLPRWIINTGPQRKINERQRGLRAVFTSSLSSLLHTTERWLRFIKVASFRGASGLSGSQPHAAPSPVAITLMERAANVAQNDRSRAWPALVLRNIVTAALNASDGAAGLTSLPGLVVPRAKIQIALASGPHGFAPLTFITRPGISKEVETNVQTRFVESSTMHFARHESQLVEKLVNSLNEIRRTQTEVKTVVQPQVEIEHLTRQVYQQLEREIKIEKERRGL
jgi:hypothetical protein